ncbi:MAG TPA: serine/threonine-protein kinase [Solirubrobacteraceae bacterium]|nr:serine/threonine-protein kinase [Solirubrobacteraceae bacterium]
MATRERPGAESTSGLRLPERYRIRRHLSTGGMASVWCAEDQVLGRTVAVKVLDERFADDEVAMRRFKREARAAARVSNHPHVVTIFDVGDLEAGAETGAGAPANGRPRPFIVMEYLAGGTVADALRVGAVRRQEAVRWIRETASALDHAHERGIVHRDIKPANLLLNRSRVLHVADFGIARLVSEDTVSSSDELFGTAAYLSPEQALGQPGTGASDRYALAVAAFELLTGQRPFLTQHFAAQARQHIEDEPPAASSVERTLPPAVDPVLARGMAKQPEDRFATAGAFVDALETALSGGIPIMAAPAESTRRIPSRRAPAVARQVPAVARAGTAIAAASAASAASAAAALRHRREPEVPVGPVGWTPAASLQRGSYGRRGAGRAIAVAALFVAVAGIAALALAGLGGPAHTRTAAATHRATHVSIAARHATRSPTRTHRRHRPRPAPTTSTPTTAAVAPPPSAAQLQLTGHEEMVAGNYDTAIATLRKAISSATPGSLTYAYGLYDLGRSMVLSGHPAEAVPVLEARLKIPNQTAVVQQELNQALQASGQVPAQMTPTQPGGQTKPKSSHPGHGPGGQGAANSGGAGLMPAHPGRRLHGHRHGPGAGGSVTSSLAD